MFRNKHTEGPPHSAEETSAQALFQALAGKLNKDGRIRAEDLITAAVSVTAELCIEAAGDFNPRKHRFIPGSRVFSDKVNQLLSGDSAEEIDAVPAQSVIGMLRDQLLIAGYSRSDFPSIRAMLKHFAANVAQASDWGKLPWSVPEANKPFILPLRVAYEARPTVDHVFRALTSSQQKLRAGVFTLAKVLIEVRNVIDRKTALVLALETVNGMAKTAPMTDEAMASAKKKSGG
jgi:hypothetical protein